MFFLARYCRLLEEGAFRGRTADFLYMLLVGAVLLTCVAPFVHIQFLGSSLAFMLVYVWGRRNAQVNMSFLGLFNFSAPYSSLSHTFWAAAHWLISSALGRGTRTTT
jgi:Derlin-2/3